MVWSGRFPELNTSLQFESKGVSARGALHSVSTDYFNSSSVPGHTI